MRRWTTGLEDELRRTTFKGQLDIEGFEAAETTVVPRQRAAASRSPKPVETGCEDVPLDFEV